MRLSLLRVLILFAASLGTAEAASCKAASASAELNMPLGLHESEATPLQFQFASGASWELCWHIDEHVGLVLSRVFYAAPTMRPMQVLDAASIGQILFKYDENITARHLASEVGLGGKQYLQPTLSDCEAGELLTGENDQHICQRFRDVNHMIKARHIEPVRRHEISLHAVSRIGTHNFEQIWRLTEDGEIRPSVVYSGRISQYTSDSRYGVRVSDSNQYAASATLLVNWRLDFNINSTAVNDQIDEFDFIPSASPLITEQGKRTLSVQRIAIEAARNINSERFRGWRISDTEYSSGGDDAATASTRVGYYLDPQGAGYRYVSRVDQWAQSDLTVTARRGCEKLASANDLINPTCLASLDNFVNDESLANADLVVWFSLARHIAPRSEDYPAITALDVGFTLIPFDWTANSMFNPPAEEAGLVRSYGGGQ